VLFDKNKIKMDDAIKWILEHGYKVKKVDETKNLYRFRQIAPSSLERQNYRVYHNHKINDIIMLVLAYKS
jgi:hypothetical protein